MLERSRIEENMVHLPGQMDRKLYDAVNRVLTDAGGKWNRQAQAHVFASNPREKLGLALETGVSIREPTEQQKLQAYYTPEAVANEVARLANVDGHRVLEPEAGGGALVDAAYNYGARQVDCFEINKEAADKLNKRGYACGCVDFLAVSPSANYRYERIVMNPPFTKNQDIKHVAHALKFLQPTGILVAIMMTSTQRKAFLGLFRGMQTEITKVDPGAFKESGTMVGTVIMRAWR